MHMPWAEFEARLQAAQRGTEIVYHIGYLGRDRLEGHFDYQEVHATASTARMAYDQGLCVLVQRRIGARGDCIWQYLAVRL